MSKWEAVILKIAKDLYDGKIDKTDLNEKFIEKNYKTLKGAIDKGFGDKYKSKELEKIATNLKENAHFFSEAKNIAMQYEIAELITDNDGKVRSFNDFKKDVLKLNKTYNKVYLQAEYQTAVSSSQHARKWQSIQRRKNRYPNLEYKTVGDERVRDSHQILEGIIKPVDDAFWTNFYPPNGWRCRCYVAQTNKPISTDEVPDVSNENVPEIFRENLPQKNIIAPSKHPYYSFTKKLSDEK